MGEVVLKDRLLNVGGIITRRAKFRAPTGRQRATEPRETERHRGIPCPIGVLCFPADGRPISMRNESTLLRGLVN